MLCHCVVKIFIIAKRLGNGEFSWESSSIADVIDRPVERGRFFDEQRALPALP